MPASWAAPWDALGGGLLAGIVSGEGLASSLTVRNTSPDGYWVAQVAGGLVLAVVVARRTRWTATAVGLLVGSAALVLTR